MTNSLLTALCAGFFGTLGFCYILQVPRKAALPAALIGTASFLLYWALMQMGMHEAYAVFLGAVFGSLAAQMLARCLRMVATIYVLMAIVPTVPGLGLYRFMEQLGSGSYGTAAQTGTLAMILILGISLGIATGSILFRWIMRMHGALRHHKRQ